MALQPVRGTRDILPAESARFRRVTETARTISARYGYDEIATPIFEATGVFARTLGEATDVVTKEMYTFQDRNGDSLTLRPEGTAGIARAVISNGLSQHAPLKYYYEGPMFRHERPQKGRYRQLHQIGVELFGVPEPLGDIEVIVLAAHILDDLGLLGRVRLELNSLGDGESRAAYRETLVEYLRARREALSPESQDRLERNPLRILDSKDLTDKAVIAEAPAFHASYNTASADFFAAVRQGLDASGIAYVVNPRLVRGFDYYCHTAFEFITEDLGAQGTVLAGGRYDGLVEMMGGSPLAGVGWAAGIERLGLLLGEVPRGPRPIAVVPVGAASEPAALALTNGLRRAGYAVDLGFRGNVARRLKRANKIGAVAAVLIGEDEMARGVVTVRDLATGEQAECPQNALAAHLERYRP